jgi:hypothetical protein
MTPGDAESRSAVRKPACINLRQRFGDLYKVQFEESYYAERPEFRSEEAPWLMVIPCLNGHICPWGGRLLAACTRTAGPVARRLKKLPFAQVAQDGDDGANVLFDVRHFDEVAKIMKPRRRRRLSDQQKRESVERLRRYWPRKGQTVKDAARQGAGAASECEVKAGVV